MKKRAVGLMSIALTLLLLVIFTSACSGNDSIEVTFDGNKCILSGSSDLELGVHQITVINSSDFQGRMTICRADKGKVWQDILDFDYGDDEDMDSELGWPPWCLGFPSVSVISEDSNQVVYEYTLRDEGQYFVVWEQSEPDAVWPCAPLIVEKAAVQNNPDDDSFLLDKEENFGLNDEYLRRSGGLSDGAR